MSQYVTVEDIQREVDKLMEKSEGRRLAAGVASQPWSIAEMIERTRDYSSAGKVPETFRDLWERLGNEE